MDSDTHAHMHASLVASCVSLLGVDDEVDQSGCSGVEGVGCEMGMFTEVAWKVEMVICWGLEIGL